MDHRLMTIPGTHKVIVTAFTSFVNGLEAIVGAEKVVLGEPRQVRRNLQEPQYRLHNFDAAGRTIYIDAQDGNLVQSIRIPFTSENVPALRRYLTEYVSS